MSLSALSLTLPFFAAASASATVTYTPVPQSQMSVVKVDSNEPSVGAPDNVLDGDPTTIWHTKWQGGKDPLPHNIVVKLGDKDVRVGRVRLTPRQTSNGSGRIHEYRLEASTDANCTDGTFTEVATGEFDGLVANAAKERTITLDTPTTARCLNLVYLSSWGGSSGADESPAEEVASLAEFNVDSASGDPDTPSSSATPTPSLSATPTPSPSATPAPVDVTNAKKISSDTLEAYLNPSFPQVIQYRKGTQTLDGTTGAALASITIDETAQKVTVAEPTMTATSATYHLTFADLPKVSMDAVVSIDGDVVTWKLTKLTDPDTQVHRVQIPGLNVVSATSATKGAEVVASNLSIDRAVSGDHFYPLASMPSDWDGSTTNPAFVALATNGALSAGFETNAVEDNTARANTDASGFDDYRYITRVSRDDAGLVTGTVSPGTFTWLGASATTIGRDADPFISVKVTGDANKDKVIDWQDAAIAARDIRTPINGEDDVANQVIKRIPFNIVSQATHPFLTTLDDTKRISLATDGLGQSVLLKGYQAEGHDSAHPDYADHYNDRAGGKKDLDTLVKEGANWNATFGVHVNSTESYSEADNFSEDLLRMPPQPGWDWMNQSYKIDSTKDLGTGAILQRFQDLRDEMGPNLSFLYMDVYYPSGWQGQRLTSELEKQGWTLSTEWADKFPLYSTWSHWANDEGYGGSNMKGINSQVIRFISNANKDVWNPDPMLSNANVKEFEGWGKAQDGNAFFQNIWERNLPTKFLQESDIMTWHQATSSAPGAITFANGTKVTSPLTTISGTDIPTDRTITFDGATVYTQGTYLLPWKDGGTDRLYHYNPAGGQTTWTLTDSWKNQTSLTMYTLTDQGKTDAKQIPVTNGQVTITAEAGQPYVLYPTSAVPTPKAPNWGEGTPLNDPSFFAGNLQAWTVQGNASVKVDQFRNSLASLGEGASSIAQTLHDPAKPTSNLPAGTYSAWAWVQIAPKQTRDVTVSVSGESVTPAEYQDGSAGKAATTVNSSTAINATASDTKHGRYFQRVPVRFTTDGSAPVTFSVAAADGSAEVQIDDVRVVPYTVPDDPAPTDQTILFEDFEHVDTGYGPFVTGVSHLGGDARTQLAERHEPYSQKGWYGINTAGQVVEGGKLTDNVLDGQWSLLANEENTGLILRSTSATIPFIQGHRYRVSVDHETAFANTYALVIGRDVVNSDTSQGARPYVETQLEQVPFPEARTKQTLTHEFTADFCGVDSFIGVQKLGGGRQSNLTLDNLRIEDLGVADQTPACAALSVSQATTAEVGKPLTVTTTVTNNEKSPITNVKHSLTVPEGWTVELADDSATDAGPIAPGATSVVKWTVHTTDADPSGTVTASATYAVNDSEHSLSVEQPISGTRAGEYYLSDMQDRVVGTPANGWGPVEWDMSNGPQAAKDGQEQSIGQIKYPKGIGAHADSLIQFDIADLGAKYFTATVGVDDEVGDAGSIFFWVLDEDNNVLYKSPNVVTGSQKGIPIKVDVSGVKTLKLVVDKGTDGNGSDHADWAMARLWKTDPDAVTVTPTAPTVKVVDGPNNDVVTAPTIEGITYECTAWSDNMLTCTATVQEGYQFAEDATTTWTFMDANTQPSSEPTAPGSDESTGPTDSAGPTESTGPTESGGPTDSTGPTESGGPTDSTGPTESTGPTDTDGPSDTGSSSGTGNPDDSGKRDNTDTTASEPGQRPGGLPDTGGVGPGLVGTLLIVSGAAAVVARKVRK